MKRDTGEAIRLFSAGRSSDAYEAFGAHRDLLRGGIRFTVWAPGAKSVRVTGPFCQWQPDAHFMEHIARGVWSLWIRETKEGDAYKFVIETEDGRLLWKADPFAFTAELRPATASVVAELDGYEWHDAEWTARREAGSHFDRPLNIYEVHAGSWKRRPDGSFLSYAELAGELIPYVLSMGYTHIELLPLTEHPLDGSWGYQPTGFFAPTSRYGAPQGLMELVDRCHAAGIGVILDWVPGHFCRDEHGLGRLNGSKLYESRDRRQWGVYAFDFSRPEVKSFLLSSAAYWLREYHFDGLRVDGVSSMLYLNFAVDNPAEKRYNKNGGEEDMDAVSFLRELNTMVGREFPGVFTAAEESTAWPLVTYPPDCGGLGFHYKWNMGWMNDSLRYFSVDFDERPSCHELMTFSMTYAFSENYILPFSHDEVVHGKRSLVGRMPGGYDEQFAGLRALRVWQMCHPGGKLSFMGNEFAQFVEWRFGEPLEWFLLNYDRHAQYKRFTAELNRVYLDAPVLWEREHGWDGFEWLEPNNRGQSVFVFARRGAAKADVAVVVLNLRPVAYTDYRIGAPEKGSYREAMNTDAIKYGGGGRCSAHMIKTEPIPMHGQRQSLSITLPPLAGVILVRRTRKLK